MDPISLGAAKKALNPIRRNNVICIGDSITEGDGKAKSWPWWLQWYLPNCKFTNLGLSGSNMNSWTAAKYPLIASLEPKPGTAIVMIGTNQNFNTTFKADYTALIKRLINDGIRPIICAITPRGDADPGPTVPVTINPWLRETFCPQHGLAFIDTYSPMILSAGTINTAYYREDSIHPNTTGEQVIAKTIFDSEAMSGFKTAIPWHFPGETNRIADPTLLLDSNSDGVPNNWTRSGDTNVVHSSTLTAHPDEGNWLNLIKTSGPSSSSSVTIQRSVTSSYTAGDVYYFAVDVLAPNIPSTDTICIDLVWYKSDWAVLGQLRIFGGNIQTTVANKTRFYGFTTVPTGGVSFCNVVFRVTGVGASTLSLGKLMLRKTQI